MTFVNFLGFIGLSGIAVLILIYILKPNYQQKIISSTFVWKLSLKYRRKRIPIDRFRNILLFLCQLIIITLCAFMLAQPIIKAAEEPIIDRKIIVIDGSVNMLTVDSKRDRFYTPPKNAYEENLYDDGSRFILAVEKARELGHDMLNNGGQVTVILASERARVIISEPSSVDEFDQKLYELVTMSNRKPVGCGYGNADIDGAMKLCEEILNQFPNSEIFLLTGTEYIDKGKVTVIDVSSNSEWNMGILDCSAEIVDNHFLFKVTVAVYGSQPELVIEVTVTEANGENTTLNADYELSLDDVVEGQEIDVYFGPTVKYDSEGYPISEDYSRFFEHYCEIDVFSFKEFHVNIYSKNNELDSFYLDNSFALYGGTKEVIRIQYSSLIPNNFIKGLVEGWKAAFKNFWNIEFVEKEKGASPELEGFDLYIFEHQMPKTLPTDGVIIMINPDRIPTNLDLGVKLGDEKSLNEGDENIPLIADTPSPILKDVDPSTLTLFRYRKVITSTGFDTILMLDEEGDPALLVRNEPFVKVAILPFSLHYSSLPIAPDASILFFNLFEYFLPPTIMKHAFEIGEEVTINSRSGEVELSGGGLQSPIIYTDIPAKFVADIPGTYSLTQTKMSGDAITEKFYVRIPMIQSNIFLVKENINEPLYPKMQEAKDKQLLIYFAMALIALLFLEWLLQAKNQF